MEYSCDDEFPGFQTCVHKEGLEYRRPLSRLQLRAPRPLQIYKLNIVSDLDHPCNGGHESKMVTAGECSSVNIPSSASAAGALAVQSSSSSFSSFYHSKGPIPLLSPLVLPSLMESSSYIQQGTPAKSM